MVRTLNEDVPGMERTTTIDQLGSLDIGRIVTLLYADEDTVGANRAKRRRYFLKQIIEQPRFKGTMPQQPQYILDLEWATTNLMTAGRREQIGPLDGSRRIAVGPIYKREPLKNPFAPVPRSQTHIPIAPKKDRPANLVWRSESS